MRKPHTTVSEYLKTVPTQSVKHLRVLRTLIRELIPQGVEVMRYGIPTLQCDGKNVIHYGGFEAHVGLYPGTEAIAHFSRELRGYKTSKGTVQFSLDSDVPRSLVKKIVLFAYRAQRTRMKS